MTYKKRKNLPFAQIIYPTPMIMHIFERTYTVILKTLLKIWYKMYVNLSPHGRGRLRPYVIAGVQVSSAISAGNLPVPSVVANC